MGGKTSRMPPRTANSPRFSTSSTREYAAAASAVDDLAQVGASARCAEPTGSRSPRPLTCGWSTERIGRDDDARPGRPPGRPGAGGPAGAARRGGGRRCRCAGREPLVRQRLPGGVLHDARPAGSRERSAAARSSASRPGRGHRQHRAGRSRGPARRPRRGGPPGGPTRSTCMRLPSAAALHRFGEGGVLVRRRRADRAGS